MPKQSKMKKESIKYHWAHFVLANYSLVGSLPWSVVGKTDFPIAKSSFLVRDGASCPTPLSAGTWITRTCAVPVCVLLQFVWGHLWISLLCLEHTVSSESSVTSGSYTLPIPLPYSSLSPKGRVWWRPPIYDWVPQSLSLSTHCAVVVSTLVPIYPEEKRS